MRRFLSLRSRKGRADIGPGTDPMMQPPRKIPREIITFFFIIGLMGLALGLSDQIFSNYFKDVYQIDAATRGMIEFPRELPGLLCLLIISAFTFLGDLRMAILAQLASLTGIVILGLITPSFGIMLGLLFLNSLGMHVSMPLNDSIGISLVKDGRVGSRMGQYNSVRTATTMLAGILVFVGFRTGIFRFDGPVILPFLISGACFAIVIVLYLLLQKQIGSVPVQKKRKFKLVFRKEYKFYYFMAILHGAHKQIMIVFAPWVLIELLGKKADTLAILGVVGAAIGIFFMPQLGKWIDRFGARPLLAMEGIVLLVMYILYGVLSGGFHSGGIATVGLPVVFVFILFSLNKVTHQFRMIGVVYLQSIARSHDEIAPTLSTGMSLDHVVSICLAAAGGWIWNTVGPQFVFYLLAGLAILNIVIAAMIHPPKKNEEAGEETA